jgi:hypothetical protein
VHTGSGSPRRLVDDPVVRHASRVGIATSITDFCNVPRLHSMCGFKSPIDYEHDHRTALTEKLAA